MQPVYAPGVPLPGALDSQGKPLPYVQNVSCIFPPTKELGGLYLGNFFGAQDVAVLKEYGIRAVLTTSVETRIKLIIITSLNYSSEDIPFYKRLDAHDKQNFSIIEHLEDMVEFIDEHRLITNVFVHCYAGMSRSASAVIAYLMKKMGWGFDQSLKFLRYKRSIVNPNEGFVQQLRAFEKQLMEGSIVKQASTRVTNNNSLSRSTVGQSNNNNQNLLGNLGSVQDASTVYLSNNGSYVRAQQNQQYPESRASPLVAAEAPQSRANSLDVGNFNSKYVAYSPRPLQHFSQIVSRNQNQSLLSPSPSLYSTTQQFPSLSYQLHPQILGGSMHLHSAMQSDHNKKTLHQETPIPKFGTKKTASIKQNNTTKNQYMTDYKGKNKAGEGEDGKSLRISKASGMIRPRDLPGYRGS